LYLGAEAPLAGSADVVDIDAEDLAGANPNDDRFGLDESTDGAPFTEVAPGAGAGVELEALPGSPKLNLRPEDVPTVAGGAAVVPFDVVEGGVF